MGGYTFYVEQRDAGGPRLGLLVTRQHAARASVRNRIKRCVREAFRLEQGGLGSVDVLVRPPYGTQPSLKMVSHLRQLFRVLTVS